MKTFKQILFELYGGPEKDDGSNPDRLPTILRHIYSEKKLNVGDIVRHGPENAINRIGIPHDEIKNGLWFNIRKTFGAKDERDNLKEEWEY